LIIVSAADQRFAAHFAAMLHSAWTHNPATEFYLLDCGIEPWTLAELRAFAISRGIQLTFINIDVALLRDLPTTEALSAATYARLLIPDLLPNSVERALYIDADCIIVRDLTALWRFDLGKAAVAGVDDPGGVRVEREVGIDFDEEGYINAAVMLMNLAVWRRDKLGAAAIAFAGKYNACIPDQTGMNVACSGKIARLPEEWNFQLHKPRRPEQWIEPSIIHFTGPWKPSLYSDVTLASVYLYHRDQTPFAIKRLRPYRSPLRKLINLLIGRRKYWDQFLAARRPRAFAAAYLAKLKAGHTLPRPTKTAPQDPFLSDTVGG
jgi:lipopolysaccharide biosynthesis glycosyltransferase